MVVEEKNPTTLADVTAAARDFVLGPRDNPNDNVIDLSNIKSDTTNPITVTSILSDGAAGRRHLHRQRVPLEERQDFLPKLQNYSTGEVRIPCSGSSQASRQRAHGRGSASDSSGATPAA